MFFKIFVFLAVVYSAKADGLYAHGVTDPENIVYLHNSDRLQIANGELAGQPRGTNLKKITWDSYLAQQAQAISDRCVWGHDGVQDSRFYVGQNIFESWSGQYDDKSDWEGVLTNWFGENTLYHYPDNSNKSNGHYTQLVWDKTQYVGCGYSFCMKSDDTLNPYHKYYVCNYGPGGNIPGHPPYKAGNSGCENLC